MTSRTLPRILDYYANRSPDTVFLDFVDQEQTRTYGNFAEMTARMASSFSSLGVKSGDTAAIMMSNRIEFVETWFALSRLGAIEVPMNIDMTGHLLAHVLNDCDSSIIVAEERFVPAILDVQCQTIDTIVVLEDGTQRGVKFPGSVRVIEYEELQEDDPCHPAVEPAYTDVISIMYTSGTTGRAKGVVSTQHQYYLWAEHMAQSMYLTSDDTYFQCLPLFYGDAQFFGVYVPFVYGSRAAFVQRFSASRYWEQINTAGATATNILGAMADIIWKRPASEHDGQNPIQVCHSIPMPKFKKEFEDRFNLRLVTGYGQVETNLVAMDFPDSQREGACGKASPEYEIAIVDANDHALKPGVVGEIVVRSREPWSMFSHYHHLPETTLKAFRNQWFHTGDAGYLDEEGWLYFVERLKDVIRRRGQNISAFEVEQAVEQHPDVLEAAAVAVPSEMSEDEVKLVVCLHDQRSTTPEEILQYLGGKLPRFMVPRYVRIQYELLPRTPSEKIAKADLKKEGITEDTWDAELGGYASRN